MASKGKGKGKLFLTLPPTVNSNFVQTLTSTKQHEGALDNAFYVMAQMKNGTWHRAKIIECRVSKDYNANRHKLNDAAYDYYVHYENFNRRMDEWVARSRIELTEDRVIDEPSLKKKNKKGEENKR